MCENRNKWILGVICSSFWPNFVRQETVDRELWWTLLWLFTASWDPSYSSQWCQNPGLENIRSFPLINAVEVKWNVCHFQAYWQASFDWQEYLPSCKPHKSTFLWWKGLAQQISYKAVGSFDIFIWDKLLMCYNQWLQWCRNTMYQLVSLKLFCYTIQWSVKPQFILFIN